jgi:4-hydroxyacetophenone monooxygenase
MCYPRDGTARPNLWTNSPRSFFSYQIIPEVALTAGKLTVFQRTPQWLLATPGYRSPFPPQVNWLDRNLPFHTNFMRAKQATLDALYHISEIDPNFKDPYAVNPLGKQAREACVAFLTKKLGDPELVEKMTPAHPIWSARGVVVDSEYSVADAIMRDNVELVTCGIDRIVANGVVDKEGVMHEADAIVYATGFHAVEYLYPMTIVGRGGQKLEDLWKKEGARAYLGCMVTGFPNLW